MNTALKTALKKTFYARMPALALGAQALLGSAAIAAPAPLAGAPAARAASAKTITLNLVNTSLPTALRQLFTEAGVKNYTIAPDVQGLTTLTVQDVPLRVALDALLKSASPAASVTVENGVYSVTRKAETNAPKPSVAGSRLAGVRTASASGSSAAGTGAHTFDVIPINKYDAYMIAVLMDAQGITPVPPNDVVSAQQLASAQSGSGQQNGRQNGAGFGGNGNGGNGYGGNGNGNGGNGGGGGRRGRRNRGGGGGYYGG